MSMQQPTDICATPVMTAKKSIPDAAHSEGLGTAATATLFFSTNGPAVCRNAAEVFEEVKVLRQRFAKVLLGLESVADLSNSNHKSTPMAASASAQKSPEDSVLSKALQSHSTQITETLRSVQSALEDTRYLLAACQREIHGMLNSQQSMLASTPASCGISHSSSPFDTQKHHREALHAFDANVAVELTRRSCGHGGEVPPAAQTTPNASQNLSTDVPSADIGKEEEPGNETETVETQEEQTAPDNADATPLCFTPQHPNRMRWPAEQFCYVVHVEFKRGRVRRFFSRVPVKPGTYAIVPGDRGYDCGLAIQSALWNPYKQSFDIDTIQCLDAEVWPPGTHNTIMELIRLATDAEVHRLHNEHVSMERLALNTCRDVAARLCLPMEVLDCEYQFDGTKISFFFESTAMIDFRQLNKELFRIFNARIWMQNTNGAVRNMAPPNATSSRRWRSHHGNPCSEV